jgi:molybdopterin converting factor subunit 1
MIVTARLFASFREAAGAQTVQIELGATPTVADLLTELGRRFPTLGPLAERALVAVNLEYVGTEFRLSANDEVALIPPVSGGEGL